MAKEQANYPGSLDILTVDRIAGQAVPSSAFDILESAITEIEAELRRVTTKTATTTLTVNEGGLVLVSCAVTPYTLFLPTAVGNEGLTYDFIKTDDNANLITIDADGTETINGSLTFADLNYQYARMKLRSDNANWIIVTTSHTSTIRVDTLISPIANSISVKPDGDTDDFFTFKSLQDRPTIKREGGKFIYFESSNVYDVGISFRLSDTYSGTLNYEKDNHMMTVVGKNSPFGFKANSDYVNYIKFQTASSLPEITVVASSGLKINAGGTNALLLNHAGGNVGIGTSSPSGLLDLNVATDADAHIFLSENDVTKWDIYNDHLDDSLQILAGTTLVVEIDISGNLNIKAGASYKIGGTALAVGDITGALGNLLEDTTPELGGEMDCGAHSIGFTQQTVSYNATTTTVDWKLSNKATMTFGAGNIGTFAFTNPSNPCNLILKIIQDGTGSRVVTAWDADIKWAGGSAPTLTTGANTIDILSFYFDGTNFFGVASLAFS